MENKRGGIKAKQTCYFVIRGGDGDVGCAAAVATAATAAAAT